MPYLPIFPGIPDLPGELWQRHPTDSRLYGSTELRLKRLMRCGGWRLMRTDPIPSSCPLVSGLPRLVHRATEVRREATGEIISMSVAQAILECFQGVKPDGLVVLHKHDNKWPTHLSDLRFGPQSENNKEAFVNGAKPRHRKRMPVDEIRQVFMWAESGGKTTEIAKWFKTSPAQVSSIRHRKHHKAITADLVRPETAPVTTPATPLPPLAIDQPGAGAPNSNG